MQVHVLRLLPGDDLRASLESTFASISKAQGIEAACIVSAVGSLSRAVLCMPTSRPARTSTRRSNC